MPKPPQAARSLRRYRGRARSRFAALCPQSQPTALPHTVTIPGVVAQPPTGQTSKSTRRLTGSRGPLNTGRDPYGDAVSVRLQIGTLSGFVSERRPASNRNGVRLQVGIGVRLRRYPHSTKLLTIEQKLAERSPLWRQLERRWGFADVRRTLTLTYACGVWQRRQLNGLCRESRRIHQRS